MTEKGIFVAKVWCSFQFFLAFGYGIQEKRYKKSDRRLFVELFSDPMTDTFSSLLPSLSEKLWEFSELNPYYALDFLLRTKTGANTGT